MRKSGRSQAPAEAEEVAAHRLDLGLLEHDLADPDRVGIPRTAPGHGAVLRLVPGLDAGHDRAFLIAERYRELQKLLAALDLLACRDLRKPQIEL